MTTTIVYGDGVARVSNKPWDGLIGKNILSVFEQKDPQGLREKIYEREPSKAEVKELRFETEYALFEADYDIDATLAEVEEQVEFEEDGSYASFLRDFPPKIQRILNRYANVYRSILCTPF